MTERLELSSMAPAERKKQVRFAVKAPASPDVDERLLEDLHELCEVQESSTAFILVHSHTKTQAQVVADEEACQKAGGGGGARLRLADSKLRHWSELQHDIWEKQQTTTYHLVQKEHCNIPLLTPVIITDCLHRKRM
jgi:hypothetical protein